jgi:DNA-binding transcriptional ArsR family regulator
MVETGLLEFFKALADANRLRIIGLLAGKPYAVEELAALLELRASTVSHHLSRLAEASLVSARADGYYSVYQLKTDTLHAMARRLLADETLDDLANDVDLDAYNRRVLDNFVDADGCLRTIPAQRKKRIVILRFVLKSFQPDRRYSEVQVNEILAHFHADTALLRRELVGMGWMAREGSTYWRVQESARARGQSDTWSVW